MSEEINGGGVQEVDTTDWEECDVCRTKIPPWPACKGCGQRHPPRPSRLFRASHKIESPGLPPCYCLREKDATAEADRRWRDQGKRSHLYVMADRGDGWLYWRAWPE